MASDAQRRANAENAQRSTGPRTPQGKARSARNALKHGIYASAAAAIPGGHFEEKQAEVDAFIDTIVDALDPRDGLEEAQAERIAVYYLQLRRLNRFEAEALVAATADVSPESKLLHDIEGRSRSPADEALAESALKALDGVLERASRIDSRLGRYLEQALVIYYQLQKHDAGAARPAQLSKGDGGAD